MCPAKNRHLTHEVLLEQAAGRFWALVQKAGPDECWEWLGTKMYLGYGRFSLGSRSKQAHRIAYELVVGLIPEGMEVDHRCGNRGCVNPAHLRPCTHSENLRNMVAKKGSKSGLKGVSWHKASRKWAARIMVNRVMIHLGHFKTPEEAHTAYCEAATRVHGEYANTGTTRC